MDWFVKTVRIKNFVADMKLTQIYSIMRRLKIHIVVILAEVKKWRAKKMKARIPPSKQQIKIIKQETERYAHEALEKQREGLIRRLFKTMIAGLHDEFGFGHDRCLRAFKAFNEIINHSDEDEVFWEHIDRMVIDDLKIPFEKRDYTDNGKVVEFDD